jgi:hypothetical protein
VKTPDPGKGSEVLDLQAGSLQDSLNVREQTGSIITMNRPKVKPADYLFWAVKQTTGNNLRNLILIQLADHMGQKGCFPSYNTISARVGCCRQSAITHVKNLEAGGFLTKRKRAKNGMSSSNDYTLNLANSGVQEIDHPSTGDVPRGTGDGLGVVQEMYPETPIVKHPTKHPVKHTPNPLCVFDEFYSAYPKKAGRAAAKKAWEKLNPPPALINRILTDLSNRVEQGAWCTGKGKQYIPNPSTYLNGGRWEDEIIPSTEKQNKTDYADIAANFQEI